MFGEQSKESSEAPTVQATESKESDAQGVKNLEAMFGEQSKESSEAPTVQATESKGSDAQGAKAPEAMPKRSTPAEPTRSPASGNRTVSAGQTEEVNPRRRLSSKRLVERLQQQ